MVSQSESIGVRMPSGEHGGCVVPVVLKLRHRMEFWSQLELFDRTQGFCNLVPRPPPSNRGFAGQFINITQNSRNSSEPHRSQQVMSVS